MKRLMCIVFLLGLCYLHADERWYTNAVGYEIFVSTFADLNGDGVGDLRGIIEKLDYLNDGKEGGNDLGVDFIWLTPIFSSPSLHGYDITDYYTINKRFGTMADFEELVAEAKKRGIRIMLDLVLNHCSSRHPYFVDAVEHPDSDKRKWFLIYDHDPKYQVSEGMILAKKDIFYYARFGSSTADWNFDTPEVTEYFDNVAKFWLSKGVDGFRLDAARHLVEEVNGNQLLISNTTSTYRWLHNFANYVYALNKDAFIIGECWTDTASRSKYSDPAIGGLSATFNFQLRDILFRLPRLSDIDSFAKKYAESVALLAPGAVDVIFPSNHDMPRIARADYTANDMEKITKTLLLLPGTVMIYNGDELGTKNGLDKLPENSYRTIMAWDASASGGFTTRDKSCASLPPDYTKANVAKELKNSKSLLHLYQSMITLRKSLPEYTAGRFIYHRSGKQLLNFFIKSDHYLYYVEYNLSDETANGFLENGEWAEKLGIGGDATLKLTAVSGENNPRPVTVRMNSAGVFTSIPGGGFKIFKVEIE